MIGLSGVAVAVLLTLSEFRRQREAAETLTLLEQDADPEVRQALAWTVAEGDLPVFRTWMAERLSEHREADPDVREALVNGLGRTGDGTLFTLLTDLALHDPVGYVRVGSYVAAARVDAAAFAAWAQDLPPPADDWDVLGQAQGWLAARDVRGFPELLRLSRTGDDVQRRMAIRALQDGFLPLVIAVGRWPTDGPDELPSDRASGWVDRLEAATRGLELQTLASDTWIAAGEARWVSRQLARVTSAREAIAHFLEGL